MKVSRRASLEMNEVSEFKGFQEGFIWVSGNFRGSQGKYQENLTAGCHRWVSLFKTLKTKKKRKCQIMTCATHGEVGSGSSSIRTALLPFRLQTAAGLQLSFVAM